MDATKRIAAAIAAAGTLSALILVGERIERAELRSPPPPPPTLTPTPTPTPTPAPTPTPQPGGAIGACVVHVGTAIVCGAQIGATVTVSWGGVTYSATAGIGRAAALPAPPGWMTQAATVALPGRTVVVPPVRIIRAMTATNALSVTAPSTVTIWHLSWDATAGAHRGLRYDVPPGIWVPPRGLNPRDVLYAEVALGNAWQDAARYPILWRRLFLPMVRRDN